MHRFQRWRAAINEARDTQAVERVVRDYVATLNPVWNAMPEECRGALTDPDIQGAAVTLLRCELAYHGPSDVAELLHEVAHTFAAAATRLSWIRAELRASAAD